MQHPVTPLDRLSTCIWQLVCKVEFLPDTV